jgi:hypothetical protein
MKGIERGRAKHRSWPTSVGQRSADSLMRRKPDVEKRQGLEANPTRAFKVRGRCSVNTGNPVDCGLFGRQPDTSAFRHALDDASQRRRERRGVLEHCSRCARAPATALPSLCCSQQRRRSEAGHSALKLCDQRAGGSQSGCMRRRSDLLLACVRSGFGDGSLGSEWVVRQLGQDTSSYF